MINQPVGTYVQTKIIGEMLYCIDRCYLYLDQIDNNNNKNPL